jgi:hypothetical protein
MTKAIATRKTVRDRFMPPTVRVADARVGHALVSDL